MFRIWTKFKFLFLFTLHFLIMSTEKQNWTNVTRQSIEKHCSETVVTRIFILQMTKKEGCNRGKSNEISEETGKFTRTRVYRSRLLERSFGSSTLWRLECTMAVSLWPLLSPPFRGYARKMDSHACLLLVSFHLSLSFFLSSLLPFLFLCLYALCHFCSQLWNWPAILWEIGSNVYCESR